MLQELISYGRTGKESCLLTLLDVTASAPYGQVPNEVADRVIARFVNMFRSTFLNDRRHLVWTIMYSLCDPSLNTSAESFKRKLDQTPVLNFVTEACANYPQSECSAALSFLVAYIHKNEARQISILKKSRVLGALLAVLDSSVAALDFRVLDDILRIVQGVLESNGPIDGFVELGGFVKLNNAWDKLVSCGEQQFNESGAVTPEVTAATVRMLTVLWAYFHVAVRKVSHLLESGIDEALFCYTVEGAQRFTYLVNVAYDISPAGEGAAEAILRYQYDLFVFLLYFVKLDSYDQTQHIDARSLARAQVGIDSMYYFLLTPGATSGQSLLIKCLHKLRAVVHLNGVPTATLLTTYDDLSRKNPPIRAAIEQEMGEKLIYCAFTSCGVSNLGRRTLKKCARCNAVWYCGREHQVAHWKEHKKICQPCTVTAAIIAEAEEGGESVS